MATPFGPDITALAAALAAGETTSARLTEQCLAEIAPKLVHPTLGLTVAELLARCPDTSAVRRHAPRESPP